MQPLEVKITYPGRIDRRDVPFRTYAMQATACERESTGSIETRKAEAWQAIEKYVLARHEVGLMNTAPINWIPDSGQPIFSACAQQAVQDAAKAELQTRVDSLTKEVEDKANRKTELKAQIASLTSQLQSHEEQSALCKEMGIWVDTEKLSSFKRQRSG